MAAYGAGEYFVRLKGKIAVAGVVLAVAGAVAAFWFVRRHEEMLVRRAEEALPGPINQRP
jgi:hypothetical protein